MKKQVFISYPHDEGNFANDLIQEVKKAGFSTWIDANQLLAGTNWQANIDQAIKESCVLIVIMTPNAINSPYVTYEWTFALGAGIRVIPVVLYKAILLPEQLTGLQYLDFTNSAAYPWEKLVKSIEEAYRNQQKKLHPLPVTNWLRVPQKKGIRIVILLSVIAIICIVSFSIFHNVIDITRPQPVITITSAFHQSDLPAGSTGTIFQVSGQQFSPASTIKLLLDNILVAQNQSNTNGTFSISLLVEPSWRLGQHLLNAQDTNNAVAQAKLIVVPQGEANTPGPNGSPPDDATFNISGTLQIVTGNIGPFTLNISNGTVCMKKKDNDKPITLLIMGATYTDVFVCEGTYKGGKITYSRIVTSETIKFSCGTYQTSTPYAILNMQGTFDSSTEVQGTLTTRSAVIACTFLTGPTVSHNPVEGTWTGKVSQ